VVDGHVDVDLLRVVGVRPPRRAVVIGPLEAQPGESAAVGQRDPSVLGLVVGDEDLPAE
jgi:hypothetical protein